MLNISRENVFFFFPDCFSVNLQLRHLGFRQINISIEWCLFSWRHQEEKIVPKLNDDIIKISNYLFGLLCILMIMFWVWQTVNFPKGNICKPTEWLDMLDSKDTFPTSIWWTPNRHSVDESSANTNLPWQQCNTTSRQTCPPRSKQQRRVCLENKILIKLSKDGTWFRQKRCTSSCRQQVLTYASYVPEINPIGIAGNVSSCVRQTEQTSRNTRSHIHRDKDEFSRNGLDAF